MKKLLFLLLCLAAVAGFVMSDDYRPPGAPALELPGYGFHEEVVIPNTVLAPLGAVELICLWADQYQAGLLTPDEFKTLVAGRIAVMYMRGPTRSEGMYSLSAKARAKVDRFFMRRELELGIQRPINVAPDSVDYPLRL